MRWTAASGPWAGALLGVSMGIRGRLYRRATGFLIAPDLALTAGHAILDFHTGALFKRIRVEQAGWAIEVHAAQLSVLARYRQGDDVGCDVGIIRLPEPAPGGHFFGLCAAPDALLEDAEVTAAGLPVGGGLCHSSGPVEVAEDHLRYTHFSGGVGTSGAPLWICTGEGHRLVVGLHSRALDGALKAATRITSAIVDEIAGSGKGHVRVSGGR